MPLQHCEKQVPSSFCSVRDENRTLEDAINHTTGSTRDGDYFWKYWDAVVLFCSDETRGHDFRHENRLKSRCGRLNYFKTDCLRITTIA